MNYKFSYLPQTIKFNIFHKNAGEIDDQVDELSEEDSIIKLLNAGENLYNSFHDNDISMVHEALKNFNDLRFVAKVNDTFFQNGVYLILITLLDPNALIFSESVSFQEEETITELAFIILFQMTMTSKLAIKSIIESRYIQTFFICEKDYSNYSKCIGFHTLSNIFHHLAMDEKIYDRIISIIDSEAEEEILHQSLSRLLSTLCYRISNFNQQDKISWNFADRILSIIYNKIFKNLTHESRIANQIRKELFYCIFRLCDLFPKVTSSIASNEEMFKPFLNNFYSDDQEVIKNTLKFFSLLFEQAQDQETKLFVMNCIPWKKLCIRIEDDHLNWRNLFFEFVDQVSINQLFVDKLCENEVFQKILSYFDQFKVDLRVKIGKMFINILRRFPAECCVAFVENGVLQIFFDLLDLDLDNDNIEEVLDALHDINQKLIKISQTDIIYQEYEKYDAVYILQNLPCHEDKALFICQELDLVQSEEE